MHKLCPFRGVWRYINICLPDLNFMACGPENCKMLLLTELPASWTSCAHRNGIRAADVPAVLGALSGCRMEPGLCCYQTGPFIPEQIANQNPSAVPSLQTQWLVLVPLSLQLLHEDILSSAPWLRSAQLQMFWLHENHSVCLHVSVGTGFGVKQNLAFGQSLLWRVLSSARHLGDTW